MTAQSKKSFEIKEEGWDALAAIHAQIPEFAAADGSFSNAAHFETRCTGHDYYAITARDGGAAAGYLIAYDRYNDGSFYCWMAGVIPAYRRAGALRALMTALEGHARARGHTTLRIKTRNDKTAMLRWLVANGYMFTAIDARTPLSDTRLHLRKEI